jgi:parvulin-like peptidyl-prolyl isomerase
MVNGRYVFLEDYERQAAQYEQMLVASGLDPESEGGQSQLEQARQEVLERLIDEVLIEEGASELGIRLNEELVDQQLAADVVAGGGPEAFEEWLAATGQTTEDYRIMLRRTMLVEQIRKAIAAEAPETAEQDRFELWLEDLRAAAVIERFVSN